MFVRDLHAACVGFVAACSVFAVQRYLVEPTLVVALLLITSAVAFVVALTAYAARLASHPHATQRLAKRGHAGPSLSSMNGNVERPAPIPLPARSTRAKKASARL